MLQPTIPIVKVCGLHTFSICPNFPVANHIHQKQFQPGAHGSWLTLVSTQAKFNIIISAMQFVPKKM
jgi:hypothetical protein